MDDVEKLRATVDAFCRPVEELLAAALAEQDWGPKEVLAYLVFHHESRQPETGVLCDPT